MPSGTDSTGMSTPLPGRELENDADNPCFGCGPANPAGLHLRFHDDGDAVRATFQPDERLAGWPGALNAGFTFLAMMEACTWALWERLGPSLPTGEVAVRMTGPTRLDGPVTVEARVTPDDEGGVRVEMTALQDGRPTATARMDARRPTPEEAAMMAPRVPASLRPEWQALAAKAPRRPA